MIKRDDTKKAAKAGRPEQPGDAGGMKPGEYLRPVIAYLRKGEQKEAYALIQHAILEYPDDPFILSYYGCLQALVDKKYRAGVDKCRQAISMLKNESKHGEDMLYPEYGEDTMYPIFYLNLGKAFVVARRKRDAFDAFEKGLEYDRSNREILMEIRSLGSRKRATVPFLDRSNPVNKYLGKMMHKAKAADKKK